MQIDWVTVVAQVVNFLILVYLLKRFLYQPVLEAMERRRQRIVHRLEEAEERSRKADASREEYEHCRQQLEASRQRLLQQAKDEIEVRRKAWLDEARQEVDAGRQAWYRELAREREETEERLRREVAQSVLDVAGHLLSELANADLEHQMVNRFLEQLDVLDESSLKELREAADHFRVRSAFELEPALRARITRGIHEHIDPGATVDYEQAQELLGGLELSAGGLRIGWSLADHLDVLESRLKAGLRSRALEAEVAHGD